MDRLNADAMIALRDAARVPLQQAIEIISEGVTKEHFAVPTLLETRFRRVLMALLDARDALA